MRIAACIVLFHPDPKDLERDIRAIAPYLDTLILWRNSGEEISLPQDIPCPVVYMGDGTNQYIAHALNESLAYCAEFGFDCLLTMDQDSEFEDFGAFLEQAESLRRDPAFADAILFAPNVNRRYGTEESVLPVESTITSGSLLMYGSVWPSAASGNPTGFIGWIRSSATVPHSPATGSWPFPGTTSGNSSEKSRRNTGSSATIIRRRHTTSCSGTCSGCTGNTNPTRARNASCIRRRCI